MDKVTAALFSLSETDNEISQLVTQKTEFESKRAGLIAELAKLKTDVEALEAQHREIASRKSLEEHRFSEEEKKISERKKQLAALGGVRSAKLMERELDIASRTLTSLEQSLVQSREEETTVQTKLQDQKARLVELDKEFNDYVAENEKTLNAIEKDVSKLSSTRDKQLEKIDQRLKNLYRRVSTRYPGSAIGIVKGGACRSCFRALPAQLYNQLQAGNMLLQCPGCGRILVQAEKVSN